jgi:hypothetical protein
MLLLERSLEHGSYDETARISQLLKAVMHAAPGWRNLSYQQQESLEMDAVKTARILCGNPHIEGHWTDKEGYARLARLSLKSMDELEEGITDIARKFAPAQKVDL